MTHEPESIAAIVAGMGMKARTASRALLGASTKAKADALLHLARLLETRQEPLFAANALDVSTAEKNGLEKPKVDRLRLTPKNVAEMAAACRDIAAVPDPVGAMDAQWHRPNGLMVGRMRVPLCVVAMIFEARPNVNADSAIL